MRLKGPSSVVVAVPVCRPARPTRAHPSLAVQAKVATKCLYMAAHLFRMETPLRGRSGGHTGAAPTIPLGQTSKNKIGCLLSLSKLQKINLRLAEGSANAKKRFWDLPRVRQTAKKDFETCRRFGKRQKKILGLAESSANGKK